jgi:hypothetical protein
MPNHVTLLVLFSMAIVPMVQAQTTLAM